MRADLAAVLKSLRLVLIYGASEEDVARRSADIRRAALEGRDPDFAFQEFEARAHPQALSALLQPTLLGGRRVVRLRGATDAVLPTVAVWIESGRADLGLLIVEAGALSSRSKLRRDIERAAASRTFVCRTPTSAVLETAVEAVWRSCCVSWENGVPGAVASASSSVSDAEQRAVLLALLAGDGTVAHSTLVELDAASGEAADIESWGLSVLEQRWRDADRELERVSESGQTVSTLLRGLLLQTQRVRLSGVAAGGGREAWSRTSMRRSGLRSHSDQSEGKPPVLRGEALDKFARRVWMAERSTRFLGPAADSVIRSLSGSIGANIAS